MSLALQHAGAWLVLLAMGMPGPVSLLHCDQSVRYVGVSTHPMGDVRPTTIDDIQFSPDASEWERDRVRELLAWGEYCWDRNGCIVDHDYDPPPPPMKCPKGTPVS